MIDPNDIERRLNPPKRKITYADVLQASTPDELTEASLGRVYQHVKEGESWAILTSWKSETSPDAHEQNLKNFERLKQMLRSWGYGYNRLMGHGQEEDPKTGEIKSVSEPSLFVPGITLKHAKRIQDRFDQYMIIYGGPETDWKATAYIKDGSTQNLGEFQPNRIAKFYSEVKGRPFVFEGAPSSWMELLVTPAQPIPGITRCYAKFDITVGGKSVKSFVTPTSVKSAD